MSRKISAIKLNKVSEFSLKQAVGGTGILLVSKCLSSYQEVWMTCSEYDARRRAC